MKLYFPVKKKAPFVSYRIAQNSQLCVWHFFFFVFCSIFLRRRRRRQFHTYYDKRRTVGCYTPITLISIIILITSGKSDRIFFFFVLFEFSAPITGKFYIHKYDLLQIYYFFSQMEREKEKETRKHIQNKLKSNSVGSGWIVRVFVPFSGEKNIFNSFFFAMFFVGCVCVCARKRAWLRMNSMWDFMSRLMLFKI